MFVIAELVQDIVPVSFFLLYSMLNNCLGYFCCWRALILCVDNPRVMITMMIIDVRTVTRRLLALII
jgi:hypothetical protein